MVVLRVAGFIALAAAQPRLQSQRWVPTLRPGVEQPDQYRSFGSFNELVADSPVVNLGTQFAQSWEAQPAQSWEAQPAQSWEAQPAQSWEAQPAQSWAQPVQSWEQPAQSWEAPSSTWATEWTQPALPIYQAPVVLPAPDPWASFGEFEFASPQVTYPVVDNSFDWTTYEQPAVSSTSRLTSKRFVPTISPGVEQPNMLQSFSNVDELIAASPVVNLGTTWETPVTTTFGEFAPTTYDFASYDFGGFDTQPTADYSFNTIDYPSAQPSACCRAITAKCLACEAGKSVADYCGTYSFLPGCEAAAAPAEWAPVAVWEDLVLPAAVSVPVAPVCSPVMCYMYCEAGFEQDANGCDICSCKAPEPAHNCMTKEVWTAEKIDWCCENTGFGCQMHASEEPQQQAAEEPETGCCFSFGYGARMVPCCLNSEGGVAEADCASSQRLGGKMSWVTGECPADAQAAADLTDSSTEKEDKAVTFNCLTRERFTNEKAAWCCSNKNVGCLYAVLTPAEAPKAVEVDDPASDATCANGVLSAENKVCCPSMCGTCGGTNCGNRLGGADNCCRATIRANEMLCTVANAPCVMTSEEDEQDPMDVVQAGTRHTVVG